MTQRCRKVVSGLVLLDRQNFSVPPRLKGGLASAMVVACPTSLHETSALSAVCLGVSVPVPSGHGRILQVGRFLLLLRHPGVIGGGLLCHRLGTGAASLVGRANLGLFLALGAEGTVTLGSLGVRTVSGSQTRKRRSGKRTGKATKEVGSRPGLLRQPGETRGSERRVVELLLAALPGRRF